ncbi:unnamed protein product [Rotaria magnacalcarata]|uniref:ACB domain-containing protein n=1 Tax=Rotaria magnacalcarata TaxID=392030 RepID=A0A816B6F7_9BILA|nr:unnamed protein product [Rotaria magnacalcarata]
MALYYDEILAGNCFGQIDVTPTPSITDSTNILEKKILSPVSEFGYTTEELYYKARKFVKEKKEQIQLKYGDNIRLIALSKQEKLGKWNASYTRNVGFLDVVGNDRKQAWIALGDMTKEQAMEEYVKLLLDRCSIFRIHLQIQDVKYVADDQSRQDYDTCRQLEQEAEKVSQYELAQVLRLEKQKKKRENLQRKQIQDALNQQTYSQFKAYAEQQYKDNRAAQEDLIGQLQEQHFQKYMQQVYQQQLIDQQLRTKATMEQTSENITLPSVSPSNVILVPSTLANTVLPTPLVNVVSTNIVSTSSPTIEVPPTNMEFPSSSSIPLQVITPMPSLGPAPSKLPPLVHPPPPPPQLVMNANASVQDMKLEPVIPVQTKFETLNLDTPMELILPVVPQPSMSSDPTQQSSSSGETTNELSAAQVLMGSNQLVPASLMQPNGTVNSNNESTLPSEQEKQELPDIITANMWTRKDIKEFKGQIRQEKDAVIKIGSGETVTVRVPTHDDGHCIFWEFSTDYYDLGFGVYFEWNKAESNTVTVHVSDSSDEEEEEHEDGEKKDIEKGRGSTNKPPKPRQSEIVPIYRRDCHEEVYAGSHQYPDMNKSERIGAHDLLSMLNDVELMSVKDTVTKSMISTESRDEAIDACLKCSQSAMQLLRRKKIRRDILMQYLARKSITISPGADKVKLIKQIIDFWNNGTQSKPNDASSSVTLPSINQLSHQFTEWFYTSWNGLSTFQSDHFFPDCHLTLIHENNRRVLGAYYVCDALRSYVSNRDLRFYPNPQSNKVEESKHGLVLIQVHGTIHQRNTCTGIFDQSFGLVRDPNHCNNYLIKFSFLNMQTQEPPQQQQLLSANQSIPTYLVDIMQNYDQTMQQQIDSTDYFIDEPDNESD